MNKYSEWNYQNNQIRILKINNEPWWILADVCKILELSNPSKVSQRLDDDEKANCELGLSGGETNIINESGLFTKFCHQSGKQARTARYKLL